MELPNKAWIIEQLDVILERLRKTMKETHLVAQSGIARQTFYNQRVKERLSPALGFGFGVIRTAMHNGMEAEALRVLTEREFDTTAFRAAFLFPDLTSQELALLEAAEGPAGSETLSSDVIRDLITRARAPRS